MTRAAAARAGRNINDTGTGYALCRGADARWWIQCFALVCHLPTIVRPKSVLSPAFHTVFGRTIITRLG
jgi:hypothetical protein